MMKTINKFLVLLMLAVPFVGFTGCSKDDDKDSDGTIDAIVGNYKGSLNLFTILPVADNVIIKVEKEDDSHVKFPVDITFAVSMGEVSGPTVKVAGDCVNKISYANSKYTIEQATGNEFTVTITQPGEDTQTMQTLSNLPVTISGTIEGNTAELNIVVPLNAQLLAALANIPGSAALIGEPDANGNILVPVNFSGPKQ
jgi:hypothetical protein